MRVARHNLYQRSALGPARASKNSTDCTDGRLTFLVVSLYGYSGNVKVLARDPAGPSWRRPTMRIRLSANATPGAMLKSRRRSIDGDGAPFASSAPREFSPRLEKIEETFGRINESRGDERRAVGDILLVRFPNVHFWRAGKHKLTSGYVIYIYLFSSRSCALTFAFRRILL